MKTPWGRVICEGVTRLCFSFLSGSRQCCRIWVSDWGAQMRGVRPGESLGQLEAAGEPKPPAPGAQDLLAHTSLGHSEALWKGPTSHVRCPASVQQIWDDRSECGSDCHLHHHLAPSMLQRMPVFEEDVKLGFMWRRASLPTSTQV